jgi:hypothetical protein
VAVGVAGGFSVFEDAHEEEVGVRQVFPGAHHPGIALDIYRLFCVVVRIGSSKLVHKRVQHTDDIFQTPKPLGCNRVQLPKSD